MTDSSLNQPQSVAKTLGVGAKRSRFSRFLRFLLICAILGGAAAYAVPKFTANKPQTVQYETQKVKRGDLVVTVSATGTLAPINQVDVGIEVSGTVKSVEVDYNDHVEVGQVLARLDTSKLEAQTLQSTAALESAKAKLLQAQASVTEAQAQMARLEEMRRLSDGKMPSQHEYDAQKATLARAKADEGSAKASVSQAQATLDANRSDLTKAVVLSPINGVVLTRSIEPGQTVAAMFQSPILFTLAEDLSQMELLVDVDEADVGQVREGQDATFTVDAYPEQVFPAKTTQVRYGSETVDGVVTYKTVLRVDNSALTLRPGMTATAVLTVDKRENALLVPNAALRFAPPQTQNVAKDSGGSLLSKILPRPPRNTSTQRDDANGQKKAQHVWVVENGQPKSIEIAKGLSDGKWTEITRGELQPDTELITDMVTPQ